MNRILIVDDCPYVAEAIATNLRVRDVDVEVSNTIEDARRVIATSEVALAIVDALLDGQSGVALVDELRDLELPAILMSGDADMLEKTTGPVLPKPFSGEELAAICLELLEASPPTDRCAGLLKQLRRLQQRRD